MLKFLRFIGVLLLTILIIFVAAKYVTNDDAPYIEESAEHIDKTEVYPLADEDSLALILNGELMNLEHYPKLIDGSVYLPYKFVRDYFNDDFYWDAVEGVLTLTTVNQVMRMRTDELTYYVNDEPADLEIPVKILAGEAYLPLSLVQKFSDFDFKVSGIKTIVIEDLTKERPVVVVKRKAVPLRFLRDDSSPIVDTVESEEVLKYMSGDRVWTKVLTDEGLVGYIRTADVELTKLAGEPSKKEVYDYDRRMSFDGGVNLAWHQIGHVDANAYLKEVLKNVHSLNVISPTWFSFKEADGSLANVADLDYVREAHAHGLQVWALFSNSFDPGLSHAVLSSTSARQKVIKQLLSFASIYELDGINVDFEMVAKEDGRHFVQFMKELTPYLKKAGLVVSVDMYIPSEWTAHYGRKELGEIVDYVMVMTYDEHWSTSPKAGSVASLGFVDKGIKDTLKDVPKEKVVLGLPFYNRVWEESKAGLSSKAYGMDYTFKLFNEQGVKFEWLDKEGQFYGQYRKGDVLYRVWLEDVNSIKEKMSVYDKYDLAGVASWKLGLENDGVWDTIAENLN